MEKKKVDMKIAIIIILSIIIVAMGITIGYLYIQRIDMENMLNELYTNDELYDDDAGYITKLDNEQDWVYTEVMSMVNDSEAIHEMPLVNIDTQDAKAINEEIKNLFEDKNKDSNKNDFTYQYYTIGDILSLLIIDKQTNDYKVYNIDLYTGLKINATELLEYRSIMLEDLYEGITEVFDQEKQTFILEGTISAETATGLAEKSMNSFKDQADKQLYVDEEGDIHAITKNYFPSGEEKNCDIDLMEQVIMKW